VVVSQNMKLPNRGGRSVPIDTQAIGAAVGTEWEWNIDLYTWYDVKEVI